MLLAGGPKTEDIVTFVNNDEVVVIARAHAGVVINNSYMQVSFTVVIPPYFNSVEAAITVTSKKKMNVFKIFVYFSIVEVTEACTKPFDNFVPQGPSINTD